MNVQIRPLKHNDIKGVAQIERQAFPTLWPPTPFKREVENRLAKYLVAWEPSEQQSLRVDEIQLGSAGHSGASIFGRLLGTLKGQFLSSSNTPDPPHSLLGFVGLWFMSGEAHITAIAVEESSRGRGIGELLLMSSMEMAMKHAATEVSLEVRVSNHVAQSLYAKYGFQEVGTRKAYYSDNREDAAIMTTQPINTDEYQEKLQLLKEAYKRRHGELEVILP